MYGYIAGKMVFPSIMFEFRRLLVAASAISWSCQERIFNVVIIDVQLLSLPINEDDLATWNFSISVLVDFFLLFE